MAQTTQQDSPGTLRQQSFLYNARNFMPIRWQTCWTEPENCQNLDLHTSKIGNSVTVSHKNNTRRADHIRV